MRTATSTLGRGGGGRRRRGAAVACVMAAGGALGVGLAVAGGNAVASRSAEPPPAVLDASHLPPLLRLAGGPVELRYDVYCAPAGEADVDEPCDATGSVFVRRTGGGAYREVPLVIDRDAAEGRYVAVVPEAISRAGEGFEYYAVVRSPSAGRELTLPAGGAGAPQRSVPLVRPVVVELGRHEFGGVRAADARVAEAAWGDGADEMGLEQGRNAAPVGASSFDVGRGGAVHVLDEVHGRILRWSPGDGSPNAVRAPVDGTLADLAVADDGTYHVLEVAAAEHGPRVRSFGASGTGWWTVDLAERTASAIRLAGSVPVVLSYPSAQWMAAGAGERPFSPSAQVASGRPGRLVPGQGEVVVYRHLGEVRLAVVGPDGVRDAWRVTSETPIAEVQLAEPRGNRLVVVLRLYTERRDEFVVLALGPTGLVQQFAVPSMDWAETAPLGRFRLRGSSLFQLGSTSAGIFVDRFDLEVS